MKKGNIKLLIIIILLITFTLATTYAFLELGINQTTQSTTAGCFEVNYTGQIINSAAIESTLNYQESASSEVTLSKSANCDIYTEAQIYIHTNTETTAPISDGSLKYIILNGSTTIGQGSIITTGDTTIATVPLTSTAVTYKIYLWIDSNTSNGTYHETIYSGYIYANSVQTSTVKGT